MTERWSTPEEIAAARERFEAALGWRRPAAYGIGRVDPSQVVTFARVNVGEHHLPNVVMATVVGHRGGSASYRLTRADLDRAIALLEPAEACTEYDHPNLQAWREIQASSWQDGDIVAVFAGDLDDATDDPYVRRLLDLAA